MVLLVLLNILSPSHKALRLMAVSGSSSLPEHALKVFILRDKVPL